MKVVHLTEDQWEVFYGALVGLHMPGATGEAFYHVSPLIQEAVDAVRDAKGSDRKLPDVPPDTGKKPGS